MPASKRQPPAFDLAAWLRSVYCHGSRPPALQRDVLTALADNKPVALWQAMPASYQKFTSQDELGKYLTAQYHIRTPNELASCETCHR